MDVLGQRAAIAPRRSPPKGLPGGDRRILALGEYPNKAALAYDRRKALDGSDVTLVQRNELGEGVQRAHHAPVEHPGQSHVLDEAGSAGDLVGQVTPVRSLADHPVITLRAHCDRLVDL